MRTPFLLLLLPLAACDPATSAALGAAEVASIPIFHRGLPDLAFSAVTGRNCSAVRLDQGKALCAPQENPPPRPAFCTRSLGVVDCWTNPQALNAQPVHEVADGPRGLTPEQEANRTQRWPGL